MLQKKSYFNTRSLFALIFCYFFSHQIAAQSLSANSYIITYAPLAQSLSAKTGIPSSIILGIALIESGHGSSENCKMLRNHFGIKGKNHLPEQGINYKSAYRSYLSDEASFGHFCNIIKRKKYYPLLKENKDFTVWLSTMNKSYYSSAGLVWVNKILYAIKRHHLNKFDLPQQQLDGSPRMNWMHA